MRFHARVSGNVSWVFLRGFFCVAVSTKYLEISQASLLVIVAHPLVCAHSVMRVAGRLDAVERQTVGSSAPNAVISQHDKESGARAPRPTFDSSTHKIPLARDSDPDDVNRYRSPAYAC